MSTPEQPQPDEQVMEAMALLRDPRSAKRRSGAKRLRKLKDPVAGPALLEALRKEVLDPRTWETQYQLVMALAEVGYTPALPFLDELSHREFEATMVYVALGDALVRLGRVAPNDPSPVVGLMQRGNGMLINGAFRAVAMLRLKLTSEAVVAIVQLASSLPLEDGLRFWVAAAAAGWNAPEVQPFLQACLSSPREELRKAAEASLQQKYLTWHPL